MTRRRVVVTGLGCISPVGNTVAESWANLLAGKPGIDLITQFDAGSFACKFAGEVKGPPNQPNNTNETGALDHANSACAASGLNDFDSAEGQNASQVQTAADSWKYYELPKGAPGTLGLCRGGTGER